MKNRVSVTIAGQEYALIAAEDPAYMKKVAAFVDEKMREVLESAKVSSSDAAVLTALNVADAYFKEHEAAENLRAQVKQGIEEANELRNQLSEAKREIFKLQQAQGKKS